jgi:putative Mg2+ transporter-C (MgtC) family protein
MNLPQSWRLHPEMPVSIDALLANPEVTALIRILLAGLIAGLIGLERELAGKAAGIRTYGLVGVGAAMFTVTAIYGFGNLDYASRIVGGVITGIGFLGAGAILRTGITIRGLTTAAGLWLVAAIGMAAGGGMYLVAVFTTGLGLGALTLLRRLEDRGEPAARQRITAVLDESETPVTALVEALERTGAVVAQEQYERQADQREIRIALEVRTSVLIPHHELARTLADAKGVKHIKIESL